jgi:hypothetical protein
VVNAGEHVEQRPIGRLRKAHVVGRDDRHAERARQRIERDVGRFFITQQVPLQLHVHVAAPEQPDEAIEQAADAVLRRVEDGTAGERDESGRIAFDFLQCERAFAFRRTHLHACHEATKISIAFLRFHKYRQAPRWDLGFGIWALGFNR